jgi:hypothetical protein
LIPQAVITFHLWPAVLAAVAAVEEEAAAVVVAAVVAVAVVPPSALVAVLQVEPLRQLLAITVVA